MSDNGPYTQPPQYPGGEGNPGGQPGPYGGSYGPQGGQPDPNTGGQPSYHSGPYQAPYGDGGSGGQQAMGYGSGRSEERRVGKSVDLGGRRIHKKKRRI